MKASLLSLAIATVAFAGSSIYFWSQLEDERARADELIAQSRKLNERLVELEKARDQFSQRRFAGAGGAFGGGPMMQGGPPGAPPSGHVVEAKDESPGTTWPGPLQEPSPAFQKTMRNQMRVGLKRMYAGLGDRLGLSDDDTNKLLDLLADQQSRDFKRVLHGKEGDDLKSFADEGREQNQAEITDLLGAEKAQALQKFQESMPARMELEMIAGQLEGSRAPLSEDQNKRLLDVMVEERSRVQQPQYDPLLDSKEMQKAHNDWQDDYNERVAAQARNILNSQQLATFDEYQQFQKEMGQRMFVGMQGGVGRRVRSAPGGNVTFTAVAAPAAPADKKPN